MLQKADHGVGSQDHAADAAAPASRSNSIHIEGLSKIFRTRQGALQALDRVDLSIRLGEFISVIGPSGCGKSTLLMMIAGLDRPSHGVVTIGDRPVTGPVSDIGIVFQQDVLLEWRTAIANVMLQAEIRGLDRAAARSRAMKLLAMVGLDTFADAYPHELSGGMRQRVSICRALLHDPPLLVMDEPFGSLDALTRDQLQIDLLRLWGRGKMTIVFITHSIAEAVFLSDRIVVMSPRPGRIEQMIDVNLSRPRRLALRDSPEYAKYMHQVTDIFKSLGVLQDDET